MGVNLDILTQNMQLNILTIDKCNSIIMNVKMMRVAEFSQKLSADEMYLITVIIGIGWQSLALVWHSMDSAYSFID